MKRISYDTLGNTFLVYIFVNLLTIPLSPMGGKMMSEKQYAIIAYLKIAILCSFGVWALLIYVRNIMIAKQSKRTNEINEIVQKIKQGYVLNINHYKNLAAIYIPGQDLTIEFVDYNYAHALVESGGEFRVKEYVSSGVIVYELA